MTTTEPDAATARFRRTDAEILERFRAKGPPGGASRLLGLELTAVDQANGRVEATFKATTDMVNPIGTVQGGLLTAMLDELMSVAAIAKSGFTVAVPSLEIKTSYLKAARPGVLKGWGRCIRLGRNIAFIEGALHDADGNLIATASSTAVVVQRLPKEGGKGVTKPTA